MSRERIGGLQVLRAILALMVAAGHSFLIFNVPTQPSSLDTAASLYALVVLQAGNAVMIFYVLSGFVLSAYFRGIGMADVNGYLSFIVRRLIRLWPVAAASVLLGIGYVVLVPNHRLDIAGVWFNASLFPQPLGSASLVLNFLIYDWDFNGVLWSIWIEITVAFIMPFLVYAKDHLGPVPRLILGVALAAIMVFTESPLVTKFLFCFYLGLHVHHAISWISGRHAILAVVALMAAQGLLLHQMMDQSKVALVAALSGFVVVAYHAKQKVAYSRLLEWLGELSYSFYAVHLIVMHATAMLLLNSIFTLTGSTFIAQAMIAAVSIAIAVAAAIPVYILVEKPSIRLATNVGAMLRRN